MIALSLLILGFLLIASPAILAILAGADTESDEGIIDWLMSQSLENIVLIRAMMLSGCGLIWASVAVHYLP